ncbi:MAG TPA: N-acetylmuramoyl-L-alanine amidase [Bryobacteraceae bacterium]|nr:N-acetylmuramoyl-L-alanine amidase [Bryobacteraceae bacterium]
MTRLRMPLLALLAMSWQLGASTEGLREVTAVRCWSLHDVTRVVIAVSDEFEFHAERAHNPERIFFDIFHSRPRIEGHRFYSRTVDDPLVKKVRVAETLAGVTRIVLDLQTNADYSVERISNPDRLIVELRAKGPVFTPPASQPAVVTQTLPAPPALTAPPQPVPAAPVLTSRSPDPHAAPAAPRTPPATVATPGTAPAPRDESAQAAKMSGNNPGSLTRALGLKIRRVVLDPGHGGHDDGTIGPTGLLEKDLVLDVALRLGKLIESRMGSEVIFTRSDDTFIPLERRTAIANENKADLFLSIHANSSPYPRIAGVESYYLNFTTSKDALAVASRENASSDKSVFELHDLIQKITLQDKAEESKEFAGRIQSALFPFAARYDPGIKNRGVKKAPFVVLIGASMPSVLAEIGFLSNRREEALLKLPEHRQKLAEALYRGVYRYAQSLSHFEMAQAADRVKN